jgi:ketosteroid isomerase-like protein
MTAGAIEAVISIYAPEAVFLNQAGEVTKDRQALRQELTPLAAVKPRFDFAIKQVLQTGDIALMHTKWKVSGPQQITV